MGTCFTCKKKIGMLKSRGSKKDVIHAGYVTPESMTDHDRLCQSCLDEIKRTQVQGKKIIDKIGVTGQIILCLIPFFHLILQVYSFHRIQKVTRYAMYSAILYAIPISLLVIGYYVHELKVLIYIGISGFIGAYFIPVIWVIDWTRKYNQKST